jgi:hypothetical protein
MNKDIIQIGEAIHDAMFSFVRAGIGFEDGIQDDLSGGCAIGSYFLTQHVKKRLGLPIQFKAHSCHAWTECLEHVYDITYHQFDSSSPKVFVIPSGSDQRYVDDDYQTLKHIQTCWPEGQQPRNYRLRWERPNKCHLYLRPGIKLRVSPP